MYEWKGPHNCRDNPLLGALLLQSRTHSSACKILSTLVQEPHSFVPLESNVKDASHGMDGPFLYKLEFSLIRNQFETNDAFPPIR